MKDKTHYFFAGIGGSGMNPLAQILNQRGHRVSGSDRSNDRGLNRELFSKLSQMGIALFPQSDPSLPEGVDRLVVSTAVEETMGQVQTAKSLQIEIVHRAQLLSELFNTSFGIGVAGTSGKTTVTAMIVSVLKAAGKDPTFVNGGIIKQFEGADNIGNAGYGTSPCFVAEVDESDGSIVRFSPAIGVITNISKDHKEMDELIRLFRCFSEKTTQGLVLNGDCAVSRSVAPEKSCFFGLDAQNHIKPSAHDCFESTARFVFEDTGIHLSVAGVHNIYNSLAAIAVCRKLNIPLPVIKKGLEQFRGVKRRLDIIGKTAGITVIDDFAHNPDKVAASLSAIRKMGKRVFVIFQPHGYGPTRFLLEELAEAFTIGLKPDDVFLCLDIYDAGGTAQRNISSKHLVDLIHAPEAFHATGRGQALEFVKNFAREGDVIAVMGARDDTLNLFAREILTVLSKKMHR